MMVKLLVLFVTLLVWGFVSPSEETTTEIAPTITEDGEFALVNLDEDEDDDQCDASLSNFVRNFNTSAYLPDDYQEIVENIKLEELHSPVTDFNSTIDKIERLGKYREKLANNQDAKNAFQYLSSMLSDKLLEAKLSSECSADLLRVMNAARNLELWALKIPDSWANSVPSGLLSGHISTFGEYDQCIKVKSPPIDQGDGEGPRHIYGRYCQVQINIELPDAPYYSPEWEDAKFLNTSFREIGAKIIESNNLAAFQVNLLQTLMQLSKVSRYNLGHYGVCFPNACSADDIERIFNSIIYPITKIPVAVSPELCSDHADLRVVTLDEYQWFSIYVLSVLSILVISSTLYHIYLREVVQSKHRFVLPSFNIVDHNNEVQIKENQNLNAQLSAAAKKSLKHPPLVQRFILAFSFIENSEILFRQDKRFGVLDTLRFVLTVGVFSLQSVNFSALYLMPGLRNIVGTVAGELGSQDRYWFARTPGTWVDGFMFCLGLVIIVSQSGRLKRSNGQFSFINYVFKRWFRLSVAMLGTFIVFYLYPLTGDGPLWYLSLRFLLPACKRTSSIISSFLYYSNWNSMLYNFEQAEDFPICNLPTWFLSASTQIYLFLPIVFLPLYHYPKTGFKILLSVVMLSPIFTTFPAWALGHSTYFDITDSPDVSTNLRKMSNYHVHTFQYVTSTSVGMLFGWFIKFHPNYKFPGGRRTEILLWILSVLGIYGVFASNTYFWTIEETRPRWMTLTWVVVGKFVWPSCLGYITYMCVTGRAKTMNKVLSVRTLQPIAKLSYSIYLLRLPVIFYRYTTVRYTYGFYYWQTWENIAIDYTITAFLAFCLYILFEAPSIAIIKIFESDELWKYFEKSDDNHNNNNNHEVQSYEKNVSKKTALQTEVSGSSETISAEHAQFTESQRL